MSGLFFADYFSPTTAPSDGNAVTAGLRLAFALFGPWATTGWLLGSVAAALVAAVASGWIIGALQWILLDEPDASSNRWIAASAVGAVAAALIYPGFPWSLALLSTTAAGAIAGGLYSLPGAVVLMADHARQLHVLAAPVAR